MLGVNDWILETNSPVKQVNLNVERKVWENVNKIGFYIIKNIYEF